MTVLVNDRDALLTGNQSYAVPPDRAVVLTPSSGVFKLAAAGNIPLSYLITPILLGGLVGAVTYTASPGLTLTYSGNTATLLLENMTVDYGFVTASVTMDNVVFTSAPTVFTKIANGAAGTIAKKLDLMATSQIFAINKVGIVSPSSITLTALQQGLADTPNWTVTSGTAQLSIGSDGYSKVLTFSNTTSDTATIRVEQDGLFDTVTIAKLREGADGISTVVPLLTNESVTLSGDSDGNALSLVGAATNIKVYIGTVDDTANWTFTTTPASSAASLQYTLSANGAAGGLVTVTGMAPVVSQAYVDIIATKSGISLPAQRFNVNKVNFGASGVGSRGAGWFYGTGSAWSDDTANAATPGANVSDDVVTISNGGTYALTKKWNGTTWNPLGQVLDGSLAVTGSFGAAAINTNGLTIRNPSGGIVLDAGSTLAQQASANPNLVPRLTSWTSRPGGAVGVGLNLSVNAEYGYLPSNGSTYTGINSPPLGIAIGMQYTVSFDAYCDGGGNPASRPLIVDIIGTGVDSNGITVNTSTVPGRYSFTEVMPAGTNGDAYLRVFSAYAGSNIIIYNVKVEFGPKVTPWIDSVITSGNSSQFVAPNALNQTQVGGDFSSTNYNGIVGPGGAGFLLQRSSGNFYGGSAFLRGSINGGDFSGYGWPRNADNSYKMSAVGFYVGPEGALWGQYGANRYLQITNAGNVYAPGFTLENGQLTLTNTILIAPQVGASMTGSVSPAFYNIVRNSNQQFTNIYAGSFTATAGNTSGNLAYQWSVSSEGSEVTANMGSPNGQSCVVTVTGKLLLGQEMNVTVVCRITDLNNGVSRGGVAQINIQVQ